MMRLLEGAHAVYAIIFATLLALSNAGSVSLPSYPLAVKLPYLSAWIPGNQIKDAPTAQPEFWAGQSLTWMVLAGIGGATHSLFGVPSAIANVTGATTTAVSYMSSHTYISLTAGEATFTLDFFSPVLPGTSDYARQSLPYFCSTVNVSSSATSNIHSDSECNRSNLDRSANPEDAFLLDA